MHLKGLNLVGFKTFADRTQLQFGQGITAIVGPNGSGKSNIVDSILWALGERSLKSLRSSAPTDVIFAGNGGRRPTGLAEVTLTLDNADGKLPVQFSEVSVTRRVFRDGETEYLINKTPCRLRDIHELFLDTGIGADTYAIVTQSEIDAILSAKPEDRRQLFEQVAGVQKYRFKRADTKRKLERTEQNLTRVRDIMFELENQLEPLRVQAQYAREYQSYLDRLRQLQLALLAHDYDVRLRRLETLTEQRRQVKTGLEQIAALVAELENTERALDSRLRGMEETVAVLQRETTTVITNVKATEGKIAVARERLRATAEQREFQQQEIGILAGRAESAREQIAAHERELDALQQTLEGLNVETLERSNVFSQANARLADIATALEEKRNQSFALTRQISDKRNSLTAAHTNQHHFQEGIAALQNLLTTMEAERGQVERSLALAVQTSAELKQELDARENALRNCRERLERWNVETLERSAERNALREAMSAAQSRLHTLQEMEASFEGLFAGVRAVMQAHKDGRLQGRFALVADVLRVPPPFETAMEVALGNALQNVIAHDEPSVKDAMQFLKATQSGRATFLPLPLLRPSSLLPQTRQIAQRPGVCGVAVDLVQCDEVYRPAVGYLLNRVVVVQNLDVAMTLARQVETGCRIVTLEGELVLPAGAMTGGAGKPHSNGGLLQRKREIEELSRQSAESSRQEESLRQQLIALQDEIAAAQVQLREREQSRVEHLATCARHERETEHLEREQRRLQRASEQTQGDIVRLSEQSAVSSQQEEELRRELSVLEQTADAVEVETATLRAQWSAQQTQREELGRQVAEMRAHHAAVQERSAAVQQNIERLNLETLERSNAAESHRVSITRAQEEEARLVQQIASDEHALTQLTQAQSEKEQAFESWRRERQDALRQLQETTQNLRQQRQMLHQIEEELHRIELRETQTHTEMEDMQRRFRDEFSTTPEDALPRKDDIESKQLALDEISVIKENMSAMGNVNLGAISQQQQLAERLDFLRKQREDLERAQADLESIIADIDQRTRDQFMQTFNAVAREFDVLFQRVFDGGTTRLSLTNPDNLLETGIDVRVRPPGKAEQDLLLLSGGERALTALALMLSLLRVKPSPFVVLDEVDAPLDETNVGRFTELLREFSDTSQFIIITHNKGSMEAADALYGVTMEEHGVSKLVSVRLTDGWARNGGR
jgi:chromosome segregation protein